tara:strand:+ start:10012 stop:10722 length:711 start_codon:yes stop_codon:yes gene_type:complete
VNNKKNNLNIENIDDFINNKIKIIFLRRRVSLNLIEFLRGKYNNETYIKQIFSLMTTEEIVLIKNNSFDFLWKYIWCDKKSCNRYKKDYIIGKRKFDSLKTFIKNVGKSVYTEPEWGFPKGRRKENETNFECAKREFEEETNLDKLKYKITNIKPLEENYISTNKVNYCHNYYLAELIKENDIFVIDYNNKEQYKEIGKVELMSVKKCLSKVRLYQTAKRDILINLKKMFKIVLSY